MIDFATKEKEFLAHVAVDYVALSNLVRIVTNHVKVLPDESEFLLTLDFLTYLVRRHSIKFLYGPDMAELSKTIDELNEWLKKKWNEGKYDEIDYALWFDMDEQDIPSEYRLDKAIIEEK